MCVSVCIQEQQPNVDVSNHMYNLQSCTEYGTLLGHCYKTDSSCNNFFFLNYCRHIKQTTTFDVLYRLYYFLVTCLVIQIHQK